MYKRIFQFTIILATIGFIGFVYYELTKGDKTHTNVFDVVSPNYSIVMEVNAVAELRSYFPMLRDWATSSDGAALMDSNPFNPWLAALTSIDSLKAGDEEWSKALQKGSLVFAASAQASGQSWMLALGMPESNGQQLAKQMMSKWIKFGSARTFKGVEIEQNEALQYAFVANCLVVSTSNALMEDIIIRANKGDKIFNQSNFQSAYAAKSEDGALNLFINMDNEEWMVLNPERQNEGYYLSGFAVLNQGSTNSFALTDVVAKSDVQIADLLPSSTTFLDLFCYGNFESGWAIQEGFHANSNMSKYWSQAWKDFGDTCACDLNDLMLSWRGNHWGTAIVDAQDSTTHKVMFIHVKDSTDVIAKLLPLLKETSTSSEGIMSIKFPQLFERNRPQSFLIECNFIRQIGNYVFIAATEKDLLGINTVNGSLSSNGRFAKVVSNATHEYGRMIFQTDYYVSPLPLASLQFLQGFESAITTAQRFKENMVLVEIHHPIAVGAVASYIEVTNDLESQSVDMKTDDSHSIRKWEVINHNTQAKEILKQNDDQKLVLQEIDGKQLWQRPILGNVQGQVVQVDVLRNAKLQYAFTTEQALHLIDRNGKDLTGFPVVVSDAKISSPLFVIDYNNDRNYRLLFTDGSGFLRNYSTDGKLAKGWKGGNYKASEVVCFKVANVDYLFVVNDKGNYNVLNRLGEIVKSGTDQLKNYDGGKVRIITSLKLEDVKIKYTTIEGVEETVGIVK